MYKKWGCISLVLALILAVLAGCAQPVQTQQGKLHIVATLFPQYDFARQIAGNRAQVTMLLPVGMDTHSYDPTPADILSIQNADLFVYTGEQMESWAHRIVAGVDAEQLQVVDISKGITLLQVTHNAQETEEQEQDGHDHTYDPHIWTSPKNAQIMVQTLLEAMCAADVENADYYKENAERYIGQLETLDQQFCEIVQQGKRNKILFASRFALLYFTTEYGLQYQAAFDSCTSESEAGTQAVAGLINTVQAEDIPVVYYEELSEPKIAKTVCEETGCGMLLFHSCHNISKEEQQSGATYLSLMQQNAEHLKEGLQ